MRRSAAAVFILCATLACAPREAPLRTDSPGSSSLLWTGLQPGPYLVGNTLHRVRDSSRGFPAGSPTEESVPADGPRPLQISIWYPAEAGAGESRMRVQDYLYSVATEIDFATPDAQRKEQALSETRDAVLASGVPPTLFDRAIERQTLAIHDAPPHSGPFPLILHAPGSGASAFQNLVACEYLASHGYVVAAAPSIGTRTRSLTPGTAEIETGVLDLEFVLAHMRSLPNVGGGPIGLSGYSWGGLVVTFLAMREPAVGAVASLDGSLFVKPHLDRARSSPAFEPSRLDQPFLNLLAAAREWPARTLEFQDHLKKQDVYVVRFNHLYHGDFASMIIELVRRNMEEEQPGAQHADAGYTWQCRYLRAFFDAYLRADGKALAFLKRAPEGNKVPEGLLSIERKLSRSD